MAWTAGVIAAILGFGIYQYKTAGWDFSVMSESITRVKTWVSEHKNKPHSEAKTKLLSKVNLTQEPLHFEFYTALPNMQVSTPTVENKAQVELKPEMKTTLHEPVKVALVKTKTIQTNAIKTNTTIVTADELERELSGHLSTFVPVKKEQFAIQLGVFKNHETAKHYQETMQQAGFKAVISPFAATNKNLYRVQLGPYANKNQANSTRQQLQVQGINGVIYKLK